MTTTKPDLAPVKPAAFGSKSFAASKPPTIGAANRPHHRRSRNEFRAWLIWELNKRGANLSPNPTYLQLQAATLLNLVEV